MAKPDRYSQLFHLKSALSDDQGKIEGYASTFMGEPDAFGDIIMPGAYKASLAEHAERDTAPAMFWAHDQAEPIGRWLSLAEDDKGLKVIGQLTLGTNRGAEAYELAKDDALGLSIGYTIPQGGADYKNGVRQLKQINLMEVSLVGLPASHTARITSVKSATQPDLSSPKEVERTLKALGFSGRQAKRFMAGGYRTAFIDTDSELKSALESLNDILRG